MSNYTYEAVDASGLNFQGSLEVEDQSTALKRIREMGLFPIKVKPVARFRQLAASRKAYRLPPWMTGRRIKPAQLAVFTRQLATLRVI
jgi:type II secretory pathway component PulF